MRWETSLGTPGVQEQKLHNTAASARTRATKGLKDLMEFGAVFNHALQNACAVTLSEIRDVNLNSLPVGEWREWRVSDEPSGLVHVVRLRRME